MELVCHVTKSTRITVYNHHVSQKTSIAGHRHYLIIIIIIQVDIQSVGIVIVLFNKATLVLGIKNLTQRT